MLLIDQAEPKMFITLKHKRNIKKNKKTNKHRDRG